MQCYFAGVEQAFAKDYIVWIMHVDYVEGDEFCPCIFLGLPKEINKAMDPTSSILFPPKPCRGFVAFLSCLLSYHVWSKADKNRISAWLPLSISALVTSHLSICVVMTIASMCSNETNLMSVVVKIIGI
jgi:hypothetical protein